MIFNCITEIWRAQLVNTKLGREWDWVNASLVASVPGSYQPILPIRTGAIELIADRETTVTKSRVYIRNIPVVIKSSDRVKINGAWWDIHTEPGDWIFPGRKSSHIRLILQAVGP